MEKPNIFRWATTELSQDAFICWLIEWGLTKKTPDKNLTKCARELLKKWHNLSFPKIKILANEIQIIEIRKQVKSIDVLIETQINKKRVFFIVEDKTNSTQHDNQLERYRNSITDKTNSDDQIICVLLKTGQIYSKDKPPIGWILFNRKQFLSSLVACKSKNEILKDKIERLQLDENYYKEIEIKILSKVKKDFDFSAGDPWSQWFLMWNLKKKLENKTKNKYSDKIIYDLYNGTSYGRPWTQISFTEHKGGVFKDFLLWRFDKNSSGFYLSLRQYDGEADQSTWGEKKDRLDKYRKIFNNTQHLKSLTPSLPNNMGLKESEIGLFIFHKNNNTPNLILRKIPLIHDEFCQNIVRQKNKLGL